MVFVKGITVIELPVAPFDQITVPVQPVAVNTAPNPEQMIVLFVEITGIVGISLTVIGNVRGVVLEPQALFAITLNVPEVAVRE